MKWRLGYLCLALWLLVGHMAAAAAMEKTSPAAGLPHESAATVPADSKAAPSPVGVPDEKAMTDIHDIKPLVPVTLPGSIHRAIGYGLLGTLLAALLGATGFCWWKKRHRKGTEKCPAPHPPETRALDALEALAAETGLNEKEFYFRLSAIMRAYLSGRFGLDAMEMTTEELLPAVDRLDMERTLKTGIREFQRYSDPIKFADMRATQSRKDEDMAFVRNLVQKTTPEVQASQPP